MVTEAQQDDSLQYFATLIVSVGSYGFGYRGPTRRFYLGRFLGFFAWDFARCLCHFSVHSKWAKRFVKAISNAVERYWKKAKRDRIVGETDSPEIGTPKERYYDPVQARVTNDWCSRSIGVRRDPTMRGKKEEVKKKTNLLRLSFLSSQFHEFPVRGQILSKGAILTCFKFPHRPVQSSREIFSGGWRTMTCSD